MSERNKQVKRESQWQLVDISELPVVPGVEEARQAWQGKEVWILTPWKQWRRGKVQEIRNDGAVLVVVYQKGTSGIGLAFEFEGIAVLLRLA